MILADVLKAAGLPVSLAEYAALPGHEPVLPSSFRVDAVAQASIAASALAAAAVHQARGGPMQRVTVPMRDAAIAFRGERHMRLGSTAPREAWDSIAGLYRTQDGWVRLHTNFPHHRAGIIKLLNVEGTREAVAAALAGRGSVAFETEATAAGLCVSACRTQAEWFAHPHHDAIAAQPLLIIERIGDAPRKPLPEAAHRPLSGMRVLDLTRVIAGPVGARTLALHGADVLHITSPHLPSIPALVMETGAGKRCAELDLRSDAARFAELVKGADAVMQSYRYGALAGLGFSDEKLAELNPGIVVTHLSAYGVEGPWAGKRGFDSLVQTATGMNAEEAAAAGEDTPRALPCQALDHASGYLLALGTMAAWLRRAEEGGSWRVRVSLARTGHWLRGLGRLENGFSVKEPGQEDVADLLETHETGFGLLTTVKPPEHMELTPCYAAMPAMPLGSHTAKWL
jgi:crotonobetainyl-CoA:carnitine CoA-transferase CaiB-like acyl-CoA transferase